MKLITFGDSWTEGVGGNLIEEDLTSDFSEKTKIRQKYCWPNYLSKLLDVEYTNFGVGGSNNKIIFESVCNSLENNLIDLNDFVIIMWSSSLRDPVPFFPKEDEWHFWNKRYISKKYLYDRIFKNNKKENLLYNKLKNEYKEWFISNLYNDYYYDIINQNYILYLQFMFDKMGIRYLFCDAFDSMVSFNILKEIDKTNFINQKNYWNFKTKTLRDFLEESKKSSIWQDFKMIKKNEVKHPNMNGYKLIAEELYNWIQENNLLIKKETQINLFI